MTGNFNLSIFDEIIERRNTGSMKYDFEGNGVSDDTIPMWVADMDFRTPEEVSGALRRLSEHGIFGYPGVGREYDELVCGWFRDNFGWDARPEWNVRTPTVVFALATAVRALTDVGDAVMIQQPVYRPFSNVVLSNNRKLIINELVLEKDRYIMDLDALEKSIIRDNVKAIILCSPHNPVGRVWTRKELAELGDICLDHGVKVISDEIHSDFVFTGYKHTVFADISKEFAANTITCTSPTKTFNLAGIQTSNTFISGPSMKARFEKEYVSTGIMTVNTIGLVAADAAYRYGRKWLDGLLEYLEGNISFLCDSLEDSAGVDVIRPEGTYLPWLDFRKLGLNDDALFKFLLDDAKLWLHRGTFFGKGGSGFMRMNVACPRSVLETAVDNLTKAVR
jgi:cystathionine beta-lyase